MLRLVLARRLCSASMASRAQRPKFKDMVRPELLDALRQHNIFSPNAVQSEAIPLAMSGRDVMVCAQTGSGKTLMFALPLLQHLSERDPPPPECISRSTATRPRFIAQPEALVLVPTRELGMQVTSVMRQLTAFLPEPLRIELLCNGERYAPQKEALRAGDVRILVCTPSRLLYHLGQRSVTLGHVRMLIIDEADAVLCAADGIEREAGDVLSALRPKRAGRAKGRQTRRQVLLTAATLSLEQERHLQALLSPARLQRVSHRGVLVPTLQTRFHYVRGDKAQELLRLLERSLSHEWLRDGATIIFTGGARRSESVRDLLASAMPTLEVAMIHGETPATERLAQLRAFHNDEVRMLICSDVVARGLDFPGVRHVINYDLPRDVATFIHRAGRTARCGQPGLVSSLVKPFETKLYKQLTADTASWGTRTPLQRSSGRVEIGVDEVEEVAAAENGDAQPANHLANETPSSVQLRGG